MRKYPRFVGDEIVVSRLDGNFDYHLHFFICVRKCTSIKITKITVCQQTFYGIMTRSSTQDKRLERGCGICRSVCSAFDLRLRLLPEPGQQFKACSSSGEICCSLI